LPPEFTIVESTTQSLDSFIHLLEKVGAWLWQKGVKQWEPGTFQQKRDKLAYAIENGCLILAYQNGELAGGCILSDVNPGWPESDREAMYLSSLVVARFAAGKGLGGQIIDACAETVRQRGKSRLRLDCWEGNTFLKSYYQQEGFKMLEAIPENGYFVRLFEKHVV
jgi:GNAT superfamily N-acetyltransferase